MVKSVEDEVKNNIENSLFNKMTAGKIGDMVLKEFENINFSRMKVSLVEVNNGYVIKPPVSDRTMSSSMMKQVTKPLMKDVHESVKEFLQKVKYCPECKISDTEEDECSECGKKLKEVEYELY